MRIRFSRTIDRSSVVTEITTSSTDADTEKALPLERAFVTDDDRSASDGDESPHLRDDVAHDVNYRARPERYEIGRGEEGVFKVQPYKSELLPHGVRRPRNRR